MLLLCLAFACTVLAQNTDVLPDVQPPLPTANWQPGARANQERVAPRLAVNRAPQPRVNNAVNNAPPPQNNNNNNNEVGEAAANLIQSLRGAARNPQPVGAREFKGVIRGLVRGWRTLVANRDRVAFARAFLELPTDNAVPEKVRRRLRKLARRYGFEHFIRMSEILNQVLTAGEALMVSANSRTPVAYGTLQFDEAIHPVFTFAKEWMDRYNSETGTADERNAKLGIANDDIVLSSVMGENRPVVLDRGLDEVVFKLTSGQDPRGLSLFGTNLVPLTGARTTQARDINNLALNQAFISIILGNPTEDKKIAASMTMLALFSFQYDLLRKVHPRSVTEFVAAGCEAYSNMIAESRHGAQRSRNNLPVPPAISKTQCEARFKRRLQVGRAFLEDLTQRAQEQH